MFLAILVVNYLLVRLLFPGGDQPVTVPYTEFREQVAKGNVASIYSRGVNIEGRFVAPITWPPPAAEGTPLPPGQVRGVPRQVSSFNTTLPAFVDPGLEALLINNKVEIRAIPLQAGGALATLLYSFGPALLLIGLYVWLYRRMAKGGGLMGGGLMGLGGSKARRYDQEARDRVTFADVAGIDEAENELVEIVDFRDLRTSTRAWAAQPPRVCC